MADRYEGNAGSTNKGLPNSNTADLTYERRVVKPTTECHRCHIQEFAGADRPSRAHTCSVTARAMALRGLM